MYNTHTSIIFAHSIHRIFLYLGGQTEDNKIVKQTEATTITSCSVNSITIKNKKKNMYFMQDVVLKHKENTWFNGQT